MTTRREFCLRLGSLAASALVAGCAAGAVPIAFGSDRCVDCGRTIEDKRFAAQAAGPDGKTYKFDSVECLADWIQRHPERRIASIWVVDFEHPLRMIPATTALYLRLAEADSTAHMAAFEPRSPIVARHQPDGGAPVRWEQLLADAGRRVAPTGEAGR